MSVLIPWRRAMPWLVAEVALQRRAAMLLKWPTHKFEGRPVEFARVILGVKLTKKQAEILNAIVKPNARVAVRSGHGVGKTFLGAIAALYWFATYPEGRVILSAPVMRQVEQLIWRTLRILHKNSGVCYECRADAFRGTQCEHSTKLDGKPAAKAETGLEVELRQVVGFTFVRTDTATGYFGDQLWIGDEAAGLSDGWLEAALAACKGGGSILAIGNPTKNTGFHADAFRRAWKEGECFWTDRFTISCFDCPNVIEGREVIKGLVISQFVRDAARLWGENSPLYAIRVLGIHPEHEKGQLVTIGELEISHARWEPAASPHAEALEMGIDVAAMVRDLDDRVVQVTTSGIAGDKWVGTVKLGSTIKEIGIKKPQLRESELVQWIRDMLSTYRQYPNQPVIVRYDAEGTTGKEAGAVLAKYAGKIPFSLIPVRASERMGKESTYGTVRDAMYANLAERIRDELSIPDDMELDDELTVHRWIEDPKWGKEKLLEKDEVKKLLNDRRSPDTAESLAICCWTGRVIGHAQRELENDASYVPAWADDSGESIPKDRRDPGIRGPRRHNAMIEITCDWFWLLTAACVVLAFGAGCFVSGVRIGMRVMADRLIPAVAERTKKLLATGEPPELFGTPGNAVKKRYADEAQKTENQRRRRMTQGERDELALALAEGKLDDAIRKLVEEELKS